MERRTGPIALTVNSSNWNVADGAVLLAIGLSLSLGLALSSDARSWALGRLGYGWIPVSIWLFAALLTLRYYPWVLALHWRWWLTTAVLAAISVGALALFRPGDGALGTASLGGYWGAVLGGSGWTAGLIRLTIAAGLTFLVTGPHLVVRSFRIVLRIAGLSLYRMEEGFLWSARSFARTMGRCWLPIGSGLRRLGVVKTWRFGIGLRSLAKILRTRGKPTPSRSLSGMGPASGQRSAHYGETMGAQGILSWALRMKSNDFQTSNIKVTTEFLEDLPLALVDKPQILHTIMALLTNSERAMWVHHGGGRLMVRSVRRGDELRITVTDDGPGIPSGGLTDVIQSNGVTDKPEGGRLMGLAQCRSMIVELGGDLRVENRLGNGATFNIFFPLLDAKPRDFAPSYRQSSFAD